MTLWGAVDDLVDIGGASCGGADDGADRGKEISAQVGAVAAGDLPVGGGVAEIVLAGIAVSDNLGMFREAKEMLVQPQHARDFPCPGQVSIKTLGSVFSETRHDTAVGVIPVVPIRWVLLCDPGQNCDPQALLCTDLAQGPLRIVFWFVQHWQLEVTFRKVCDHLGVESKRQ